MVAGVSSPKRRVAQALMARVVSRRLRERRFRNLVNPLRHIVFQTRNTAEPQRQNRSKQAG
jgi:hypothetical protein